MIEIFCPALSFLISTWFFPPIALNPFFHFVFKAHLCWLTKSSAVCWIASKRLYQRQTNGASDFRGHLTLRSSGTHAQTREGPTALPALAVLSCLPVPSSPAAICPDQPAAVPVLRMFSIQLCIAALGFCQIPSPKDKLGVCAYGVWSCVTEPRLILLCLKVHNCCFLTPQAFE